MRGDPSGYTDAGKLDAAEAEAWTMQFIADHPGYEFSRNWHKAGPAAHVKVWQAWPHLRGPTLEASAAAQAERHNQRIIDRNPLFAAMGALEEVATLTTAEDVLAQRIANQTDSRERIARDAERNKKREAFTLGLSFVRKHGPISIDELLIWRHFISFGGERPPDWLDVAKAEIQRITGGDPVHTAGLIDCIEDSFISKGAEQRPRVKEGLDYLKSLRPEGIPPQLCRLPTATPESKKPLFLKELPMIKKGQEASPGQFTFTM